jgi:hypothetical protein
VLASLINDRPELHELALISNFANCHDKPLERTYHGPISGRSASYIELCLAKAEGLTGHERGALEPELTRGNKLKKHNYPIP